jgi:hypothetical protein
MPLAIGSRSLDAFAARNIHRNNSLRTLLDVAISLSGLAWNNLVCGNTH